MEYLQIFECNIEKCADSELRQIAFAASQGWSTLSGTVAIALFSAANVVGATLMGWLVDRYHVTFALNICAVGTVMAIFLFWSFAVYKPIFYICLLYTSDAADEMD